MKTFFSTKLLQTQEHSIVREQKQHNTCFKLHWMEILTPFQFSLSSTNMKWNTKLRADKEQTNHHRRFWSCSHHTLKWVSAELEINLFKTCYYCLSYLVDLFYLKLILFTYATGFNPLHILPRHFMRLFKETKCYYFIFLLLHRFYFSLLLYELNVTSAHDPSKGRNSENISIKLKLNQRGKKKTFLCP